MPLRPNVIEFARRTAAAAGPLDVHSEKEGQSWPPTDVDPDKWFEPDEAEMIKATASGGTWPGTWSVGNRKYGIAVGDRALLIRQHRDRGIVASGRFTSEIYEDVHWNGEPDQTARYADVDFETWLPAEDALASTG